MPQQEKLCDGCHRSSVTSEQSGRKARPGIPDRRLPVVVRKLRSLRSAEQPRAAVPTLDSAKIARGQARLRPTLKPTSHSCFRKIFWAERWAPVSNSNPDKNAQNIMLTEIANGP